MALYWYMIVLSVFTTVATNICTLQTPCVHGTCNGEQAGTYTCDCEDGWEGQNCDIDIDECVRNNRCENEAACENSEGNFTCICTDLFEGPLCTEDIDECFEDNPCEFGECHNLIGGYECRCPEGYFGRECDGVCIENCAICENGFSCEHCKAGYIEDYFQCYDLNECDQSVDPCDNGFCLNEEGSFTCDCFEGYEGDRCETNTDECANTPGLCNNGNCTNVDGGYECECHQGYERTHCDRDINECAQFRPCVHGSCENNEGSYTCTCDPGYGGQNCDSEADECTNNPCGEHGRCADGVGTFTCHCFIGYEGEVCADDIDECRDTPCLHGTCENNPGSYQCHCDEGWQGDACSEDIDECTPEEDSPCVHGTCSNTDGGYTCACTGAFTGQNCDSNCPQNCAECESTVLCTTCHPGYESDGELCHDINECTSENADELCAHGTCNDEEGGYECACDEGWEGDACDTNIDECYFNICAHGSCVDSEGSYTCTCHSGYYGRNCDMECVPNCQLCENGNTCIQCNDGYEVQGNGCTDIDECLVSYPCQHGVCHDREGGYECACEAGWEGTDCDQDIDECEDHPCVYGRCIDTDGSYRCDCETGYTGSDCRTNIDECVEDDPCDHGTCEDTEGSYECECDEGWQGTDCDEDVNECRMWDGLCNNGQCGNTPPGSYTCRCISGTTGRHCETDINECVENDSPCSDHGRCVNQREGYLCLCDAGYVGRMCEREVAEARLYPHKQPGADNLWGPAIWDVKYIHLREGEMFEFFCQRFDKIYVSPHGYITLGRYDNGFSNPKPLDHNKDLYKIAGLHTFNQGSWTDRFDSNVWIDQYSVFDQSEHTVLALENIKLDINLHDEFRNFTPTFALVVTYNKMRTYPFREEKPTNTFQISLVSDANTRTTAVVYKYPELQSYLNVPNAAGLQVPLQPAVTINHIRSGSKHMFDSDVVPGEPRNPLDTPARIQMGEFYYKTSKKSECPNLGNRAYKCLERYYEYTALRLRNIGRPCFCNRFTIECRPTGYKRTGTHLAEATFIDPEDDQIVYVRECTYRTASWFPSFERWSYFNKLLFESRLYNKDRGRRDASFRNDCCHSSLKNSCRLYQISNDPEISGTCQPMSPGEIRWANGDPHLVSADGLQYSYQGVGEHIYLQAGDLQIQLRFSEYKNSNNEGIGASVITAAVVKSGDSNVIQIEGDGSSMTINSYPPHPTEANLNTWLENDDGEADLTFEGTNLAIAKRDAGVVIRFFDAQIDFTVEPGGFGDLTVLLNIAENGPGLTTRGLVGVMNGNMEDDLMTSANITLPADSTEETIYYEFGQSWLVNLEHTSPSLFVYSDGMSSADFVALHDYAPRFHLIAGLSAERRAEIELTCGNNIACSYDLAATENEEFAAKRVEFEEKIAEQQIIFNNQQPRLVATSQVDVTVGEEVVITIEVLDTEDDSFEFMTLLPEGAVFDATERSATITWTPQNRNPVYGLIVGGYDSQGFHAVPAVINVMLCDCSGHGECEFDFRQYVDFDNDTFSWVQCECNRGWAGDFCDSEVDACADEPCIEGSNCLDMTAEEEEATGRAFICSGCPDGYRELNGFCVDQDECEDAETLGEALCQPPEHSLCINQIGTYQCVCTEGYMMDTESNICVDKDECMLYEHRCTQRCINTEGAYECDCVDHYILQGDGITCLADSTAQTPCLTTLSCSDFCANETHCGCGPGRALQDQENCADINECLSGTHNCGSNSTCVNTDPGYWCDCDPGFTVLDDGRNCTECPSGSWGEGCFEYCFCATPSTVCRPDTGCVECAAGWTGGSCDIDIDECANNTDICGAHGTCVNRVGSYWCECDNGYEWTREEEEEGCQFINHCDLLETLGDEACFNGGVCNADVGGFTCTCSNGYEGPQCETDTDECATNPCQNQGHCQDLVGRYACVCRLGFNGDNCEIDGDECLSSPCANGGTCMDHPGYFTCQCSGVWGGDRCQDYDACIDSPCEHGGSCISSTISYQCLCTSGWTGVNCQTNVDECALNTHGCTHICTDTEGSYECSCHDRYSLDDDQRTCVGDDTCIPNELFCDELNGYCRDGTSCGCNAGFNLSDNNLCIDIDECSTDQHTCDPHGECRDLYGGFTCDCNHGYVLHSNQRSCELLDMCAQPTPVQKCPSGAVCVPQVGTYSCVCLPGLTGANCEIDIDNCLSAPCQNGASCEDGYRDSVFCSCLPGFHGYLCQFDYNDCTSDVCMNGGRCQDQPSGYTCICAGGFTGTHCENDLRECEESLCVHGTCIDMVGGYLCSCDAMYGGRHCDEEPCSPDPCNSNGLCYISHGENNQYRCECGAMYEGDNCDITLDPETIHSVTVAIYLRLSGEYTSELSDKKSEQYKSFTATLRTALRQVFLPILTSHFVDVGNFELTPGSIVSTYDVILIANSTITDVQVVDTVQYVVDKNGGVLPGMEEYEVLEVKRYDPDKSSFEYMWLIVGPSIGVVLILLIIIFCVKFYLANNKKGQVSEQATIVPDSSHDSSSSQGSTCSIERKQLLVLTLGDPEKNADEMRCETPSSLRPQSRGSTAGLSVTGISVTDFDPSKGEQFLSDVQ